MRLLIALLAAVAAYSFATAVLDRQRPRPVRTSRRQTHRSTLQDRLDQVGAGVTAARYRATVVGAMVAVAVVIYAATGTPALAVPPAMAVGLTPRIFYQRRHARLVAERRSAWPEAIRDVLANLAVGHTMHRSLCLLASAAAAQSLFLASSPLDALDRNAPHALVVGRGQCGLAAGPRAEYQT